MTKSIQEKRIAPIAGTAMIQMPYRVNLTSRRRFEAACMWLLACEKKVTPNAVVIFLRKNGACGVSVDQVKEFISLQSVSINSEIQRIEMEDHAERKRLYVEFEEKYARVSF